MSDIFSEDIENFKPDEYKSVDLTDVDTAANTTVDTTDTTVDTAIATTDTTIDTAPVNKYKYGSNPDGSYLTPYQTTVYYTQTPLEVAIAHLSTVERTQRIPRVVCDAGVAEQQTQREQYALLAGAAEFITPDVLLFQLNKNGVCSDVQPADYQPFYDRGFQHIYVFVGLETLPDNTPHNTPHLTYFNLDSFYDNVHLEAGLTAMYLMEYFLSLHFPSRESIDASITYQTATHLYRALLNKSIVSKTELGQLLLQMISSFKGFEQIDKLIAYGSGISTERERMAISRLEKSYKYELEILDVDSLNTDSSADPTPITKKYKIAMVYNGDLNSEIMDHIKHPVLNTVDALALYDFKDIKVVCLTDRTYFDKTHQRVFRPTGVLLEKFKELL
jgi:hypothetical protein